MGRRSLAILDSNGEVLGSVPLSSDTYEAAFQSSILNAEHIVFPLARLLLAKSDRPSDRLAAAVSDFGQALLRK